MSIATRIENMSNNINKTYNQAKALGADLTNIDKNLENLPNILESIYNNYPKTPIETGTSITLNNTTKGRINMELIPQTNQATAILPGEYDQLDYLESDGASVINIPFYPSNLTRILTKFSGLSNTDSTWAFGSRVGSVSNEFGFYATTGYRDAFDNNRQTLSGHDLASGIVLDKNKEITTINGTYTLTHPSKTFTCQNPLSIFALNNNGSIMLAPSIIKMYYFTIYENDILVHNLIPAKRKSDDVLGMYDIVGNQFYTNQGTGVFTYGSIVNVPNPDFPMDIHCATGENQVKIIGKNLWNILENISGTTVTTTNNYEYSFVTSAQTRIYTINGKENTAYNIDINISGEKADISFSFAYSDGTFGFIGEKATTSSYTYHVNKTSDSTKTLIGVQIKTYSFSTYSNYTFTNPIVVEGNSVGDYLPYEETAYPISLGTKEMFNINNVSDGFIYDKTTDKFYINRKIGKTTFNGSEAWQQSGYTNETIYSVYSPNIAYYGQGIVMSDLFIWNLSVSASTLTEYVSTGGHTIRIGIFKSRLSESSLTAFKSWLSSHNVECVYQLENATLEEITDTTLISQLRAIKNALSTQETTYIISTSVGENLPFIIKANALLKNSN